LGIQNLQGLLSVDVTLEPFKSQGRHANTYGELETIRAHVEQGVHEVEGPNGQSLVGKFKIILGKAVMVDPRDRITLPKEFGIRDSTGKFQTIQPKILSFRPVFFRGTHDHSVLICG